MQNILNKVDHTLLSPDATEEDIIKIVAEGIKYKTASVCIPPSYVKLAADYAKGRVKICTVVGFPTGYSVTLAKCHETVCAINDGADEIDMVINIGSLKDGDYDSILSEINLLKSICKEKILKVIIETCLLTDEEKIKMCEIVSASDADYIKTSTGFSKYGATREDVALLKKHMTNGKKVKAAGGIASIEDAEAFIALGADRLGTSRIVKLMKTV